MGLYQTKELLLNRGSLNKMKGQPNWEKILADYMTSKGLIAKYVNNSTLKKQKLN